jgi:D-alanyl-lipoteichoic acid acyltransferase DltB (MBOAT superfamily)
MLFNSIEFFIFLPIVFFVYWFLSNKNLKIQNIFIVIASYVFYGWWDWRFLVLILFSTATDYFVGIGLSKIRQRRKLLLFASVIINLVFLGFFKYYNFFVDTFVSAFSFLGVTLDVRHLNIILPIGISFYTFQTMSYSIDVYKGKLEPTRDFIAFAAFVAFFPQLVAGPIERAGNLLPQFKCMRSFTCNNAVDGCRQILWGFFKKLVVADNCAVFVNMVYENFEDHSGSTLLLAALLFSFQIYGDFAGYSDIAIGISKLFGFKLKQNFAYPYFSRDMAEFWRRWHISLTTWFRDYIYFPLGGSRAGAVKAVRNTFIIFLVSGFWHGANWTFIVWGLVNALYFLPLLVLKKNRINIEIAAKGKTIPGIREIAAMFTTFCLSSFAFIFFRSVSLGEAFNYILQIFSSSIAAKPAIGIVSKMVLGSVMLSVPILVIVEWINRGEEYGFKKQPRNLVVRWLCYSIIALMIIELSGEQQGFIYFQF